MSYEGYTEYLCERGHYWTVDQWSQESACPHCNARIRFVHSVDETNGYDERYPATCDAPKIEVGFDDDWQTDHYGNRYAVKVPIYRIESVWIERPPVRYLEPTTASSEGKAH